MTNGQTAAGHAEPANRMKTGGIIMRRPRLRTVLIGAGAALALVAGGTAAYPASGSVGSRPTPSMLKVIRQPVISKRLLAPAAKAPGGMPLFQSGNWAGYLALPGGSTTSFKQVVADYTVPSANCNGGGVGTGDAFAYHWIGLDGWGNGTVEQDGVADFCEGGTASYYAWWEMFPNGINLVFQVSPGDAITSRVTYDGSGIYTLYLLDYTSGQSFNLTESCPTSCSNKSAEDITEGYSTGPWHAGLRQGVLQRLPGHQPEWHPRRDREQRVVRWRSRSHRRYQRAGNFQSWSALLLHWHSRRPSVGLRDEVVPGELTHRTRGRAAPKRPSLSPVPARHTAARTAFLDPLRAPSRAGQRWQGERALRGTGPPSSAARCPTPQPRCHPGRLRPTRSRAQDAPGRPGAPPRRSASRSRLRGSPRGRPC